MLELVDGDSVMGAWRKMEWLLQGLWNRRDPRVRDRILQSSPGLVAALMSFYIMLVMYGPRMMRHKKPPALSTAIRLFNIVQISLSGYMVHEFLASRPAGWLCSPMEYDGNSRSRRMTNACLLFHLSKLVDFLDTVFLVLKKDFNRLSYLHVFHHGSMFFSYYLGTLYMPGDPSWLGCTLNCSVHFVMYSYYFLASLGPAVRKYLWWKRYLTQLQLTQFFLVLCNLIVAQVPGYRCHLPLWALPMTFVYTIVIICLFMNFYRHAYTPTTRTPTLIKPASDRIITKPDSSSTTQLDNETSALNVWKILKKHGVGCFVPLQVFEKHNVKSPQTTAEDKTKQR